MCCILKEREIHLEYHFHCEDSSENIVKAVENLVAFRVLEDRVLGRQSDTACTDDDHNEEIEITKADNEVTEPSNPREKHTYATPRLLDIIPSLPRISVYSSNCKLCTMYCIASKHICPGRDLNL